MRRSNHRHLRPPGPQRTPSPPKSRQNKPRTKSRDFYDHYFGGSCNDVALTLTSSSRPSQAGVSLELMTVDGKRFELGTFMPDSEAAFDAVV